MRTSLILLAIVSLALAGCAAPEQLVRKSGVAPEVIEIAGQWTMLENMDEAKRQLNRAIGTTNGVDDSRELRRLTRARTHGKQTPAPKVGGLVHVFLKNAKRLKITQAENGLFINFDRSIVEEYTFGEARMVTVGEVIAQRVSGWEGEQYVVETLVKSGMKLTERYHVMENGTRLRRQIVFRGKNGEEVINFQTFERNLDD